MKYFDVFNGDADGICALHQLRLANPVESTLITGVKRDISLLNQVKVEEGDHVTVLDISLDKNRDDLVRVLDEGASVIYFDHHFAGEIPESDFLKCFIEPMLMFTVVFWSISTWMENICHGRLPLPMEIIYSTRQSWQLSP